MNLEHLLPHFNIKGDIKQIIPFGNGHINDTYHLINKNPLQDDYLLQRINHHIFKNVAGMMSNIWKVTTYLQNKKPSTAHHTLTIVLTQKGQHFYQDKQGNYWRMYVFIKNMKAYDVADTPSQIYQGAFTFGNFLAQLHDFPIASLVPTIPDFHNVLFRLHNFEQVLKIDIKKRAKTVSLLTTYVFQMADKMCQIEQLGKARKIPWRVTHNDTKFNNVLLDENNKGKVVIDLDTVMPGFVHYDFGDGIRTTASQAAEDAADLDTIQVDMERYEAFAQGYLDATQHILQPIEMQYLPLAGPLLAYLMGVRFLTDFLAGDFYYKIHFEGQNLQRAKAQLDLCQKLMARLGDVQSLSCFALAKIRFS